MTELMQRYDWHRLQQAAASPIWINDTATLMHYCQQWLQLPLIALDTEFMRTETFYPIPGLIQIADDQGCYLIDPLQVEDMSPLAEVLRAPDVLKVLHAGNEDMELFRHSYGVLPQPLYDTQVGAAFAGWGFSMGLQRLVAYALEVELGKGETTSDWLQRPLTAEQEHYAALDVAYLPVLALMQHEQLEPRGRLSWVMEECESIGASVMAADEADPQAYFQRFSQVWHLDDVRRALLRDLSAWREQTCRERDMSRNRLLRNEMLLEIAERMPQNEQHLDAIIKRGRIMREYGQAIMAIIAAAPESARQKTAGRDRSPVALRLEQTAQAITVNRPSGGRRE